MNEPIGDICILLSDDRKSWMVSICRGNRTRDELEHFETRDQAIEFAIAERLRRRDENGKAPHLHLPDDCPCYWKGCRQQVAGKGQTGCSRL